MNYRYLIGAVRPGQELETVSLVTRPSPDQRLSRSATDSPEPAGEGRESPKNPEKSRFGANVRAIKLVVQV
jgi:hypothetical protein